MAQSGGSIRVTDAGGTNTNKPFPMDSDSAFHATPIVTSAIEGAVPKNDSTFMQNQVAIQRSPSAVRDEASKLSRKLSVKSNGSYDTTQTVYGGNLSSIPQGEQMDDRGRVRSETVSTIVDTANDCSLSKSDSERSAKSARSVRSQIAVGAYPVGTLRLHSPSPTRDHFQRENFEVLKSGDIFIVRDIPVGAIFGYDTKSFEIKEVGQFEGVKDLPSGAHFFWSGSSTGSLRTGFWIMSDKTPTSGYGDIFVKRCDKYNETLEEEVSIAEIRIQRQSVPELETKLQPYDLGSSELLAKYPNIWRGLTSSLKGAFLTNITSHKWNHWQVSSADEYKSSETGKPGEETGFLKNESLTFVFPKSQYTFSTTSVGRERTEQAMDTSGHIMAIISNCSYEDHDEIIGELQFCYVTGMILGNVACMEHWAHIVRIVFRAFRLALELPEFFRKFIEAVHNQLIYDENGIEGSILDHDADIREELKMILTIFKSRLNELLLAQGVNITPDQSAVGKAFEALESWLWKWGWDLRGNYVRSGKVQLEDGELIDAELKDFEAEDERGEYAPALVELDESGHEIGLIRF